MKYYTTIGSVYKQTFFAKMTKWHPYIAHMAKHMNMVGGSSPPLNPALSAAIVKLCNCANNSFHHNPNIPFALALGLHFPLNSSNECNTFCKLILLKWLWLQMLRVPLNTVKLSTKPALPIGWFWFTLLAVQASNLGSKLPTQTHQLHCLASKRWYSDTIGITLCQWFPTGVPRHPGVSFTVPRGAAG